MKTKSEPLIVKWMKISACLTSAPSFVSYMLTSIIFYPLWTLYISLSHFSSSVMLCVTVNVFFHDPLPLTYFILLLYDLTIFCVINYCIQKELTLWITWFQISSFQNSESVDICCLRLPSRWFLLLFLLWWPYNTSTHPPPSIENLGNNTTWSCQRHT